jgi:formate/nitrite transporter FocA (FNT family)
MAALRNFVSAAFAGMSIGLGGLVYLSVESRVVGSALFTIGLYTICTFGLCLYTGRICYAFENHGKYALTLPVIWLGNLVGTGVTGLAEGAAALCEVKLGDGLVSLFFLGVLCNIFIYIAVEGYKICPHELGKYLVLFFGVMGFILAGTEHCVADMFYFWLSGLWSGPAVLRVLIITLGNSAGGLLARTLHRCAMQRI